MDRAEAWREVVTAHLRQVSGASTPDAGAAEVRRIAAEAGLEDDSRISEVLAALESAKRIETRRRRHRHEARNALAGVIATVELAESLVRGESPHSPLLGEASPEERSELLESIRRAVMAAKGLASLMERALDDDAT